MIINECDRSTLSKYENNSGISPQMVRSNVITSIIDEKLQFPDIICLFLSSNAHYQVSKMFYGLLTWKVRAK